MIAKNTGFETSSNLAQILSDENLVGAFAPPAGTADSAAVVNLSPGAYTLQISGVNSTTGVALAEVYEVPSGGATQGSSIILSSSSANPGSSLTITGGNFDPNATTTTVNFTDASGNVISLPADSVTSGKVVVTVPPYLNPSKAENSSVVVSVSITQTGTTNATSGPAAFTINALPSTGYPTGAVMVAFLQQEMVLVAAAQQSWNKIGAESGGTVDVSTLTADFTSLQTQLSTELSLIQQIQSDPTVQFTIGTYSNGQSAILNSAGLVLLDQILFAYISGTQTQQSASLVPHPNDVNPLGTLMTTILDTSPSTISQVDQSVRVLGNLVAVGCGTVAVAAKKIPALEPAAATAAALGAAMEGITVIVPATYAVGFQGAIVLGGSLTPSQLQAYQQALDDVEAAKEKAAATITAVFLNLYNGNSPGSNAAKDLVDIGVNLGALADETNASSPAGQVNDHWGLLQVNTQAWTGPEITGWPSSETVDANLNYTMSVTATGSGLSYQWYLNGTEISGATGASYSISNAQPSNSGGYYVVVKNSGGSMVSPVAVITVKEQPPVITASPSGQTVNAGSSFTLMVAATGSGLTYQWYLNGDSISGATGTSYTVSNAQSSDSGGYLVVVTNTGGSTTSAVATVTVQSVTQGGSTTVTVAYSGTITYPSYFDLEQFNSYTTSDDGTLDITISVPGPIDASVTPDESGLTYHFIGTSTVSSDGTVNATGTYTVTGYIDSLFNEIEEPGVTGSGTFETSVFQD